MNGGKKNFVKKFGEKNFGGKKIFWKKNLFPAKIFFENKIFWTNFFEKKIWGKKSFIVIGSAVFEKRAINVSVIIIITRSINRHN